MKKTGTYNHLENLQFLSSQVFNLAKPYRFILKYLVMKKNPEAGASLADICRFTSNSEPPLTRRKVSKKIQGTNQTIGLIPVEYLFQKKENKHRWGQQESTYHLTLKGMLATLSIDNHLDKIYLYQNYINYISDFLQDTKTTMLIKQHIANEIHVFLLWHYVSGIQLTMLTQTHRYFLRIMNQPNLFQSIVLGYKFKQVVPIEIIKKIFAKYISIKYILYLLGDQDIVPYLDPSFRITDEYDKLLESISMKDRLKARLYKFVEDWPYLIENLQRENGDLSMITYSDSIPITKFVMLDISSEKIEQEISEIIKKMDLKITLPKKTDDREIKFGF